MTTAVSLLKQGAITRSPQRFSVVIDSNVAKGALAKGRSTSRCLQRRCKRAASLQLVADIYPSWCYAPTRLNVADPTRKAVLRSSAEHSIREILTSDHAPPEWNTSTSLDHRRARLLLLVSLLRPCEAFKLGEVSWLLSHPCCYLSSLWTLPSRVLTLSALPWHGFWLIYHQLRLILGLLPGLCLSALSSFICLLALGFSLSRASSVFVGQSCLSRGRVVSCLILFAMVAGAAPLETVSRAERERADLRYGSDLVA